MNIYLLQIQISTTCFEGGLCNARVYNFNISINFYLLPFLVNMADQTAVIVGVLVAIVVSVLALVILGFWLVTLNIILDVIILMMFVWCRVYLCCGKHRDLIWKRYEPDPVPPQRPLRVTISAGVVTIDSAMGSVNDINQDEISLQPSIAPIAKLPTVRYVVVYVCCCSVM